MKDTTGVNTREGESGGSSSGGTDERRAVAVDEPRISFNAEEAAQIRARIAGTEGESDMERFFRPAAQSSDSELRRRGEAREGQRGVIGRAWEEAEGAGRRRMQAAEGEADRIRRERMEANIAAELDRQRRYADEEARVRREREASEREAAAETLRQASFVRAKAKAKAKAAARIPVNADMGFGHYHNWTYQAVWNHDQLYRQWAMRENQTSARRSQKLIAFAEWREYRVRTEQCTDGNRTMDCGMKGERI